MSRWLYRAGDPGEEHSDALAQLNMSRMSVIAHMTDCRCGNACGDWFADMAECTRQCARVDGRAGEALALILGLQFSTVIHVIMSLTDCRSENGCERLVYGPGWMLWAMCMGGWMAGPGMPLR